MFMFCKTCKKDVEPGVDRNTLKNKQVVAETRAICPECMNDMPINPYMIKTLASLGKFYVKPKAASAFSFECKACGKCEVAKLSSDKTKAFCGNCGEDLKISEYMIKAMSISKNSAIDVG